METTAVQRVRYGDGREALLRGVVEVVAENGLDGMTFRRVAERAGVNNTLITHYFGTRDALLTAAADWAAERSQHLADLTKGAALDRDFADALTRMVADEPELQLFQYEMTLAARRRPELKAAATRLYESYVDIMETTLEKYGYRHDRAAARAVFASFDGLVLQQVTVTSVEDVREAMVRLGELIACRGDTPR